MVPILNRKRKQWEINYRWGVTELSEDRETAVNKEFVGDDVILVIIVYFRYNRGAYKILKKIRHLNCVFRQYAYIHDHYYCGELNGYLLCKWLD